MFEENVPLVSQETLHLVTYRQNQPTNDRGSTTTNKPPADAKGKPTAEVNTYYSIKGKPINHILLATAIVEVKNKSGEYVPCRALLDSASQSHFITDVYNVWGYQGPRHMHPYRALAI